MQNSNTHGAAACCSSGRPSAHPLCPPTPSAHALRQDYRTQLREGFCCSTALRQQSQEGQLRRHLQTGICASMNYGGEWSEPPESYIVLVCSAVQPPVETPHVLLGSPSSWQQKVRRQSGCKTDMALFLQGLAHCFRKDENGKLMDHFVIEPISANSLEVLTTGIPALVEIGPTSHGSPLHTLETVQIHRCCCCRSACCPSSLSEGGAPAHDTFSALLPARCSAWRRVARRASRRSPA